MRQRKANQRVCDCGAYHFPHRYGSGHCQHPELRWREQWNAEHPEAPYPYTQQQEAKLKAS